MLNCVERNETTSRERTGRGPILLSFPFETSGGVNEPVLPSLFLFLCLSYH